MSKKIFLLLSSFLLFQSFSCLSVVGWDLPATDLSDNTEDAKQHQVAIDAAGNAIAIWYRNNGSNHIIQAKRYNALTDSWETTTDLSDTGENAINPQIAIDAAGNTIAIWCRNNGSNYIIQAKKYNATTGWETTTNLSTDEQSADNPQIATDPKGNGIAIWDKYNGSNQIIQAKSYNATNNEWSDITTDLSAEGQDAFQPEIAVNATGKAVSVWQKDDNDTGKEVIQAAFKQPEVYNLPAPDNLTANKKCIRFPTQKDIVHCLTWETVENAIKYRIYIDTLEIAETISPCIELHGRCSGTQITYYVVGVDEDGNNGQAASVTI